MNTKCKNFYTRYKRKIFQTKNKKDKKNIEKKGYKE